MPEKGASRLGVATETTGVVRVWASWAPAASRWAFCRGWGGERAQRGKNGGVSRSIAEHRTRGHGNGNQDEFDALALRGDLMARLRLDAMGSTVNRAGESGAPPDVMHGRFNVHCPVEALPFKSNQTQRIPPQV